MKRLAVAFILVIAVGAFIGVVCKIRDSVMRPDVRTMAAYAFGDDLKQFYVKHLRLPHNWEEYANWYEATFPEGSRNASWAKGKFDLRFWGQTAHCLSNGVIIVSITDPNMKDAESNMNLLLYGAIGSIDDEHGVDKR